MGIIEIHDVTKTYGEEVVAIEDLSLSIEEGEVFGFLGPNGAGKSTTINMLLDFIRPTSGSLSVFGMDAQASSTRIRERVGVLPEGYDVYPPLTGIEHIRMAVETKDTDDDPRGILETVGLDGDGDKQAGSYSKGMRQRLALGFALVGDPELLILDEPSSGLDPNGIQLMRSLVRERAAQGTTVFFSSHHLAQVESVCDRVGVMNDGRLIATNTIEELSSRSGGTQQIRFECATAVPVDAVAEVDAVTDVSVDGRTLVVDCADPTGKVDVFRAVDEHATVENVFAPEIGLEETFNDLTADSSPVSKEDAETMSVRSER